MWFLQNVILFRQAYERVYIAPRASTGYCVWLVAILTVIFLPIFLAYASGGIWIKEAHYREQPLIKFRHEVAVSVQGDTDNAFYSTDEKVNEYNSDSVRVPVVRYTEHDYDYDGHPDEVVLKVAMPFLEKARRFFLASAFSYQLSGQVRTVMQGAIVLDESCGVGAHGVKITGDLEMKQVHALRSLSIPRNIYDVSPLQFSMLSHAAYTNLRPFTYNGLLESYTKRNETIVLNRDALPPIWEFQPNQGNQFNIEVRMRVPHQVIYYVPGALEELKHAWVHIASFLIPVGFIVYTFVGFVFSNQVVQTYVCSQLPNKSKSD